MAMLKPRSEILAAPGRWCAAFAAAMVLFLTVAAFFPELHEAVCNHRHGDDHDAVNKSAASGCVIAQFGAGEVLTGTMVSAEAPELSCLACPAPAGAVLLGRTCAWLVPPSCGPPGRPV
jgi:hypothetical protein